MGIVMAGGLVSICIGLVVAVGNGQATNVSNSDQDSFLPIIFNPPSTPTPIPTPTTIPTPTPIPTSTAIPPTNTPIPDPNNCIPPPPNCGCSGNLYNCSDFTYQCEAQACYEHCLAVTGSDIHRLDADNDGLACEALPFDDGDFWK